MAQLNPQVAALVARIRQNKAVSVILVFVAFIVALSTFSDASRNLLDLINPPSRADVNGHWIAKVNYDWENASYTESFSFSGIGQSLQGEATFLGRPRTILEGKVHDNQISFATHIAEMLPDGERRARKHIYIGTLQGKSIAFTLQMHSAISTHQGITFTANRDDVATSPSN